MTSDEYQKNIYIFRSALSDFQKQLEKSCDPVCEQLRNYQRPIAKSISDTINEALEPITQEFRYSLISSSGYKQMQASLSELHRKITEQLNMQLSNYPDTVQHPFSNNESRLQKMDNYSSYASIPENIISNSFEQMFSSIPFDEDNDISDYITVNESVIKEICIPDTLAIPIGEYRVKIRTDIFVGIISLIFTILSIAISICSSASSAKTERERLFYEQVQADALQWQNTFLREFLYSVDASFSSQAKSIEELRASVEANSNAVLDLKESADSFLQSSDNLNKFDNKEHNK